MIRVDTADTGLFERMRKQAARLAARHLARLPRRLRGARHAWRSPGTLWPDFAGDQQED